MCCEQALGWCIYSVRNCRLSHVLLEPAVLPGVVRRRGSRQLADLRHDGAHRRVVLRDRAGVQKDRRRIRVGHAGVLCKNG